MYCSSCGQIVNKSLSYCNFCGAAINGPRSGGAESLSESSFNFLVAALIALPIIGIGLIIGLMSVMKKELGFDNHTIMIITFLGFLLIMTSEAAIIWLLAQRTKSGKSIQKSNETQTKETSQLSDVVIKGLNGARENFISEPVPSVVDQTTRQLEPVYREGKNR
jgi:hypothetical protein